MLGELLGVKSQRDLSDDPGRRVHALLRKRTQYVPMIPHHLAGDLHLSPELDIVGGFGSGLFRRRRAAFLRRRPRGGPIIRLPTGNSLSLDHGSGFRPCLRPR